ncbi:putative germin-like protein 9-2 [Lotus japonicus]|uniref:putative germin-like protein 9-2 n=1 Tax=Lotus japonicus TaxID=34305 RepID=UPI00258F4E2B|nr:putative germin-like protein 9-2 [Lotus japonicus]
MSSSAFKVLSLVLSAFAIVQMTIGGDPDILTDFISPINGIIDGNFFTFTGFRALSGQKTPPQAFKVIKASGAEFPALIGQSVSYAVLEFPAGSINPPHTHPRSAELLLVTQGALQVGFVDTTNKLFTQSLQAGDMFVFPKGLVHFQHNADANNPALALSAFGSANAGTVSLPNTLFNSSIDDTVLALAFKTQVSTIQSLKKGFAP